MTKVTVEPGVCGFVTKITAEASPEDETSVKVQVASGCEAVRNMMEELPDTFDAYEVCLVKPGKGPIYEYASEKFPIHAGCPVISGICKCIEAQAGLALKKDAVIHFEEE